MKWGECKLIALQTMFSNEGAAINVDDVNQDYINAMPGKANEAMLQITTVGRPLLKTFRITLQEGAEAAESGEEVAQYIPIGSAEASSSGPRLVLPTVEKNYRIRLTDYCPRFRCIERNQLMLETADGYGRAQDWDLEGDDVLLLPGDQAGTYTVWYDAYPVKITAETPEETELELPEEAAALIPLYIAGELYKEDELALATMWRNEFEDGLVKLQMSYQASPKGGSVTRVRNTTGWW